MVDHRMDIFNNDDRETSSTPESVSSEPLSSDLFLSNLPCSEKNLQMLASNCIRELNNYCRGVPHNDSYGVELLYRATVQGDHEARMLVQHCFKELVLNWLQLHPKRVTLCSPEREENFVIQAFERFWQATTTNQQMEFSTLSSALHYLRVSLLGVILDSLRGYSQPVAISLLDPVESGELRGEDETTGSEVWGILKALLPDQREQRLAYLLFYCGLKPREIIHSCPQEFNDIREVYRLRCTITERLSRNDDFLRGRLS